MATYRDPSLSSLASYVAAEFDELTQRRGKRLAEEDAVLIELTSPSCLEGMVFDSKTYQCRLEREEETDAPLEVLKGSCQCLDKEAVKPCSHLYALALKSNGTSFFQENQFVRFVDLDLAPLSFLSKKKGDQSEYWRFELESLKQNLVQNFRPTSPLATKEKEQNDAEAFWYVVNPMASSTELIVEFYKRRRLKSGGWGKPQKIKMSQEKIDDLPEGAEKRALNLLWGGRATHLQQIGESHAQARVLKDLAPLVLDHLHGTGRLGLLQDQNVFETVILPLSWSSHKTVQERFSLEKQSEGYELLHEFVDSKGEKLSKSHAVVFPESELLIVGQELLPLESVIPAYVREFFRSRNSLFVPQEGESELVEIVRDLKRETPLTLPEDFPLKEEFSKPRPVIEVEPVKQDGHFLLFGRLGFSYAGDVHIPAEERSLKQTDPYRYQLKDLRFEEETLHFVESHPNLSFQKPHQVIFDEDYFNEVVEELRERGFDVQAFGKTVVPWSVSPPKVRSERDWLEVEAGIQFDEKMLNPPDILKNLDRGKYFVSLGDGNVGVLPETWLKKAKVLSDLGHYSKGKLRVPKAQALLVDQIFENEDIESDETFQNIVSKFKASKGLKLIKPSKLFQGTLRSYQRVGLSWMNFLEELEIGGCLADDMGLGKTIQVLAYIQKRKRKALGPFMIVVPKSLISNWESEAKKFAPNLVVKVYEGPDRRKMIEKFDDADIVIATYGVLRRDIDKLQDYAFDGIVLDEAQNIKNANSQTAKAAFLLRGQVRLALTGTPIENHVGELFSIFRFLIPGLFKKRLSVYGPAYQDETLEMILKGLRPFILRRTKEEVLKELPPKSEMTLYCDFDKNQSKEYQQLKRYYQGQLSETVKKQGLKSSSFHILESLLRLRQFACHPKLLNQETELSSPKVDMLIEHLEEIRESGKKALVFSQFTSFLKLVQSECNKRELGFSYLDGQTKDRPGAVEEFKTSPEKTVFLISLKAGGVGLNLTEASYCFILDPWWNPAVENQAIDRLHRIGQEDPVFVYRLITRETIEERVLELQQSKQEIGDQVLASDQMFLKNLSQKDLLFLMS